MVSLESIYEDVDQHNIIIFQYPLEDMADGAIIGNANGYGVFLDFSQYKTMRQYKAALIHETSHCATGALHRVDSSFELVERNEYKARRRSYEIYVPVNEIRQALRCGYTEPWQLADWFDLPEEDIKKALHYWVERRGVNFNDIYDYAVSE